MLNCDPKLFLVLSLSFVPVATAADRPNVVIFYTDDQGTLDVNCYGSKDLMTPNMDQLAATGVRFTQAYAHTVCCPSRAALLTGRHPQRSNINSWAQSRLIGPTGRNMALEETTLAEALSNAGYATAIFGKWHVGARRGFGPRRQGFDEIGQWRREQREENHGYRAADNYSVIAGRSGRSLLQLPLPI